MLQSLYIKNIALISEANIEFNDKFNVLSGETGSGKSVILDSINFVLGSKADKTMIRYGEHEAMVRAEFLVGGNSEAVKLLNEYDIEADGTIIITRKLSVDGKGSIKINGSAVTLSMLKSVTQHMVDVHGQSEHFFLLNEENQLKVLDGFLDEDGNALKNKLNEFILKKKELKNLIAELGGNEFERERKLDLLKYQIDEIENANLKAGEYDELKSRQLVIMNTEKILSALNAVRSVLEDEGGFSDGISAALHQMYGISSINEKYENISCRLESLSAESSDICETISDLTDELYFDSGEAEQIENRLSLIKSLKKKYGADETEILSFYQTAKNQYDALNASAELIEKHNNELEECNKEIYSLCRDLTKKRKEVSEKFCSNVVNELKSLNISNADFCVNFNEYDENTANLSSSNGSDIISFMFSANKGEPLKPLSKIISGGEMSRFMLAVKTQLKDLNGISTYIFDEIDSGISGFTAVTVAEKLVSISNGTQVLAVSHLPQVCAAGDANYLIYKVEENGKTYTKVKKLSDEEKIEEITRLTGNVSTEAARMHAKELISQFK